MTDLALVPCYFCQSPLVTPALFDSDKVLAITCRACGARGPIYIVNDPQCVESVATRAGAEWNRFAGRAPAAVAAPPAEKKPRRTHALPKKPTTPEKAPIEAVASPQRKAPRAAAKAKPPIRKRVPAARSQAPKAPDGGGAAGTDLNDRRHDRVRKRMGAYLATLGCSIETAVVKRGIKLGASVPTLYNFMKGEAVKQTTLAAIDTALGTLEQLAEHDRRHAPVESLPNTFPEITGLNRLPSHKPPARCSATP